VEIISDRNAVKSTWM